MGAALNLDTVILFVNDVERLKSFYLTAFDMEVLEDGGSEWALLKAEGAGIGLHRVGEAYRNKNAHPGSNSNVKLVFDVTDIHRLHDQLLSLGTVVHGIKTFAGRGYWLCDGEDPEGNRFQLKQKK